jgi:hypothetical protein
MLAGWILTPSLPVSKPNNRLGFLGTTRGPGTAAEPQLGRSIVHRVAAKWTYGDLGETVDLQRNHAAIIRLAKSH